MRVSILMIFLLHFSIVFGQDRGEVRVDFEADSIVVLKGATFINVLVIENVGKEEIFIQDITPEGVYPGLLLSPKAEFTLGAESQKRLPVKFLANTDFMRMKTDEITYTLLYKS